jgi:hypothetical protein
MAALIWLLQSTAMVIPMTLTPRSTGGSNDFSTVGGEATMKFLFVTYCFGNSQGQALIGVYKRGLRVALKLCDRGHEVAFFCPGRENFHDSLTALAEERMQFVDISPHLEPAFEAATENRLLFIKRVSELAPDVVVIGEAPLAGALLEVMLCAVELEIPVVCLDNAYRPVWVDLFCHYHGGVFDGIVLTGPSSLHSPDPPPYLCQVPPYIEPDVGAAKAVLTQDLGLTGGDNFVVVLAYDRNVELLATSLLSKLDMPELEVLFLSPDVDGVQERLCQLSPPIRSQVATIEPQPEHKLFGLLQLARLAIVKCAFMQVTECMSLRTPVVGYYYVGDFAIQRLPDLYQSFAHMTTSTEADEATVAAARRLLRVEPEAMTVIHDDELDARGKTATFLESLARAPRRTPWTECSKLGFTKERVCAALDTLNDLSDLVNLSHLRASYLRGMPDQVVFSLLCDYSIDGNRRFERLWGRLFRTSEAAEIELGKAQSLDSRRQLLYASTTDRILIERDLGEAVIPSTEECEGLGPSFVPWRLVEEYFARSC